MAHLVEIINIVLPVFSVIALGWVLRRSGLIDALFIKQTNRLVYYICLPLLLFYKIGTADFFANFNSRLVLGSILAISLVFLASYTFSYLRHYPKDVRGVFSQGSFRGNIAYIGLAICLNAYGEEGLTRAGILMGFIVPFLNLYAILALLWPHRHDDTQRRFDFWARQIVFNPLILASFLGIAWSFFKIPIPLILERSLNIASGMTLPLALLAIGGGFSIKRLRGDLYTASLASITKTICLPLLAAYILSGFGVQGLDLGIGILIAGTPAATANYIMADQLKGDAELAGTIVMISTLLSAFTYTIALMILRSHGL